MKKVKERKSITRKFFQDFKKFITKGNIVDLAVAVVIGAAFNKIVSSLVADVITPLISLALGKVDFSELSIVLRPATETTEALLLTYGVFIQTIIDFLIIGLTIFVIVKVYNRFQKITDYNANMIKNVQEKLDKDEELNIIEQKWLKRYSKQNPETAPKKKGPEEPKEEPKPEPTVTEKLLTEILAELKNKNDSTNK